jgi:hypothetical protein
VEVLGGSRNSCGWLRASAAAKAGKGQKAVIMPNETLNWKRGLARYDSPAPIWAAHSEKYSYAIGVDWDSDNPEPDIRFVVNQQLSADGTVTQVERRDTFKGCIELAEKWEAECSR